MNKFERVVLALSTVAVISAPIAANALPGALRNTPFDGSTWGRTIKEGQHHINHPNTFAVKVSNGCLAFGNDGVYLAVRYKTQFNNWKTGVWDLKGIKNAYLLDTPNRNIYVALGRTYSEAKRKVRTDARQRINMGSSYRTYRFTTC